MSGQLFRKAEKSTSGLKVLFSCHKDDFKYFDELTDDILGIKNCEIYYLNDLDYFPSDIDDYNLFLEKFNLFVFPITSNFLSENNRAKDIDFKFAYEHKYPLLPILVEPNLYEQFNETVKNVQILDKTTNDPTQEPYLVKLEKYLKYVLLDNETIKKIKDAFDAYIFLSYRKKDRKYAQEIMSLIHKNDFMRDIAIWYDEFLTPGENFNDEISDNLLKSKLVTLVVTPNINERYSEKGNYVIEEEYPRAIKENKPVLPIEAVETNKEELKNNFKDIQNPINKENYDEITKFFKDFIIKNGLDENNNDLEHLYFIGLAYLNGIDTEKDFRRAFELLKKSADKNYPAAQKTLIGILKEFKFCDDAIDWQKRYINNKNIISNFNEYEEEFELGNLLSSSRRFEEAKNIFLTLKAKASDNKLHYLRVMHEIARIDYYLNPNSVLAHYQEYKDYISEFNDYESLSFLPKYGRLFMKDGLKQYTVAIEIFEKWLDYLLNNSVIEKDEKNRRIAEAYQNIGDCYKYLHDYNLDEYYQTAEDNREQGKRSDCDFYYDKRDEYNKKMKKINIKPTEFSVVEIKEKQYDILYELDNLYLSEWDLRNTLYPLLDDYDLRRDKKALLDKWEDIKKYLDVNKNYNDNALSIIDRFIDQFYMFDEYNLALDAYERYGKICDILNEERNINDKIAFCFYKSSKLDTAKTIYDELKNKYLQDIDTSNEYALKFVKLSEKYYSQEKYAIANAILEVACNNLDMADSKENTKFNNFSNEIDILGFVFNEKLDCYPYLYGYKNGGIQFELLDELNRLMVHNNQLLIIELQETTKITYDKGRQIIDCLREPNASWKGKKQYINYGFEFLPRQKQGNSILKLCFDSEDNFLGFVVRLLYYRHFNKEISDKMEVEVYSIYRECLKELTLTGDKLSKEEFLDILDDFFHDMSKDNDR